MATLTSVVETVKFSGSAVPVAVKPTAIELPYKGGDVTFFPIFVNAQGEVIPVQLDKVASDIPMSTATINPDGSVTVSVPLGNPVLVGSLTYETTP